MHVDMSALESDTWRHAGRDGGANLCEHFLYASSGRPCS